MGLCGSQQAIQQSAANRQIERQLGKEKEEQSGNQKMLLLGLVLSTLDDDDGGSYG